MKNALSFLLFFLLFSCSEIKDYTPLLEEGVSLALAEERSKQLSDVAYTISLHIPNKKEDPIPAKITIAVNLNSLDIPLILDFKEDSDHIKKITVNDEPVRIHHTNEHIFIDQELLQLGKNTVQINFNLGELSLNRNEDYLYTLLVPDRARTLFPCFDQPNIKATYQLNITAPVAWQVRCGAPELNSISAGDFIEHQFGKTEKISTYLFSFVAGDFQSVHKNPGVFEMNLLYRENDSTKIANSVPKIFELHHKAVEFLKEYTAYRFPFQKMDFAAIPGFQYGGMEHVGEIQYRESALFLDESATENQHLSRAKLIAHETAHMWFGDLVTMNWFDDVWMKEVFANFMADKIVNPAFPDINHELAFMTTHYPRAYGEDRTKGTNPIRQELENLNNAGSLYGSIIYNKAPIMMRQLETTMGKSPFQKGIRKYIAKYAYENAVWDDLVSLLDNETELDLKTWSNIWVNRSSRPIFNDKIAYDANQNISAFEISQQAEDGSDGVWPQSFDLALIYPDSVHTVTVDILDKSKSVQAVIGLKKPKGIIYNANGIGYGVFPIDQTKLNTLPAIADELARGYSYINAYENTLLGNISPSKMLAVFSQSLLSEKNEQLNSLVTGYVNTLFWKYLNTAQRDSFQNDLEEQLLNQLNSDLPTNIKKSIYGLFRSIAYSESGKNVLYQIWNKDLQPKNLKLNTDDFTALAMQLALFNHPQQLAILAEAKKQLTNEDKLERFNFLMPALSNDAATKDLFFESLKDEKNRTKENWTLTALDYLNHPLRQSESIKYLLPSLGLLDEIQKTGDIFFPKGWLNNTVGNYTSKEAYSAVQQFINDNPNLNPALLKKLLQASDDLHRVQNFHKK